MIQKCAFADSFVSRHRTNFDFFNSLLGRFWVGSLVFASILELRRGPPRRQRPSTAPGPSCRSAIRRRKARGYTWRYDATVKDGHLVGHYRNQGQSPSLTLEGRINPDGTATFKADGISASADYNIKFAPPMTSISFQVTAKFDASAGAGNRLGARKCTFTFNKY